MKGGSGISRSIIDELQSWDIHGDQMEGERCFTQRTIDQLDSSNI